MGLIHTKHSEPLLILLFSPYVGVAKLYTEERRTGLHRAHQRGKVIHHTD